MADGPFRMVGGWNTKLIVILCSLKQQQKSMGVARGEPGGLGPNADWKIFTTVLACNRDKYTRILMFSTCSCYNLLANVNVTKLCASKCELYQICQHQMCSFKL